MNQVKKREQKYPNQIDQMPVKADQIDGGKELRPKFTATCAKINPGNQPHSHQHVNAVESGHHEIDAEESVDVLPIGVGKLGIGHLGVMADGNPGCQTRGVGVIRANERLVSIVGIAVDNFTAIGGGGDANGLCRRLG